ncbi:hypothetical protein AXE85_05605 [Gemella sp. oral taxon 928]|uniref:Gp15 family bacteriophage protein n=1 Tax=Gemella sp. oral taxon 928 TaxID=1785995 RepID=UPI000767EBAF|nr:Gp15 family bacteriophage protein [Gemella sp. oral taxon 928]AME09661.1 hypothetical protein AXE85_05605 [Gemella sp. oral taxon 928]
MLSLSYKLEDALIIGSEVYNLNLSFDNVLRIFDMLQSNDLEVFQKPYFALFMLTGETFEKYSFDDVAEFLDSILEEHIKNKEFNSLEYDLAGNLMPVQEVENEEQLYSLKYDADYIFASFFQAYNIDLIEMQGKLHWKKFNALLNGLPEDTKFMEVVKIRAYKPSKYDSPEYKEQIKKLQRQYELPVDD